MRQISFTTEAARRAVLPMVLFLADPDDRARQGYARINERFPELALVAVLNEAVPQVTRYRDNFPPTRRGGAPVVVPALSGVLRSVIARPGFTFLGYAANTTDTTTELYQWTRKMFIIFRDLEVRLLLGGLHQPRLRHLA
jgi:hypothetical protein